MKRVLLSSIGFMLLLIFAALVLNSTHTMAYGVDITVVNNNGRVSLTYRDQDTGYLISPQTAVKYYEDATAYDSRYYNGRQYFFYYGNEISEAEYNRGIDTERADYLALQYGKNAYRVHNTNEVKAAFDDIYGKLRYGQFVIVFSDYEYQQINWNTVKSYYNTKYALPTPTRNYYRYDHYGEYLVDRWGWSWNLNTIRYDGMFMVDTSAQMRMSADQRQVLNKMGDKVIAKILNGIDSSLSKEEQDYQKIMRAFNFIATGGAAPYDTGFYPSLLESSTSAYATLIKKKSVCIGYAVTFSYLMDRLGVTSYIIDNLSVNTTTKEVETFHSYNMVQLGGKYYIIDISSNFLGGIGSSVLKGGIDSGITISNSKYPNQNRNWSIRPEEVEAMRNAAINEVHTTTTTRAYATTTYKPTTIPKGNETSIKTTKKTTTKSSTTKKTTTEKETTVKTSKQQTIYKTTTGTISAGTSSGQKTVTIIVKTTKKTTTVSPETDITTTTAKAEKPVLKEKFKLSKELIITIAIGGTALIISLIFIIKNKRKKPFQY